MKNNSLILQLIRLFSDNNKIMMKGDRNRQDGLWDSSIPSKDCPISLPTDDDFKLNYIITKDKSQQELTQ